LKIGSLWDDCRGGLRLAEERREKIQTRGVPSRLLIYKSLNIQGAECWDPEASSR
jgi:hypothetical protein